MAKTDFGELEIYVSEESGYYDMNNEILISGLHQFNHRLYLEGQEKPRIKTIINILPSVGVQSATYPINNQREGFRSTVGPEIKDLDYLLKRINKMIERKSVQQAFKGSMSMDVDKVSKVERVKSEKNILKEVAFEINNIFSSDTQENNKDWDKKVLESKNVLDFKKVRSSREESEKSRTSSFDSSGIKIDD